MPAEYPFSFFLTYTRPSLLRGAPSVFCTASGVFQADARGYNYTSVLTLMLLALIPAFIYALYKLYSINKRYFKLREELSTAEDRIRLEAIAGDVTKSEKILEIAPVLYIFTENGKVIEVNAFGRETLGIRAGDDISNCYFDAEKWKTTLESLEEQKNIYGEIVEFLTVTKETARFFVNISIIEQAAGYSVLICGINVEKTERQRDLIDRNQRDMHTLIDAFPMPLLIYDPVSYVTLYGNAACAALFGYGSQEDMRGKRIVASMYDGADVADISVIVDEIIQSEHPVERTAELTVAGAEKLAAKTICMNFVYNGISAVITIIQDISADTKKAVMLKNMAEREKEANELKSRFIVNMSHEIRTPINAILGLSEIEISHIKNKRDSEAFSKINKSAKSLLAIVNDILDFSQLEAGNSVVMETEFCVEEVIQNTLFLASQWAGSKDIEVLADISGELPHMIIGDKRRLWQVLKNLLDNSVKFTSKGMVTLNAAPVRNNGGDGVVIEFTVSDTGIGMTEDQVNRIFKPFVQFHSGPEETVKNEGTGLGMTLTKQILELMNGRIEILSEYGQGTSIILQIPFRVPEGSVPLKERLSKASLTNKRVLIIDNSAYVRGAIVGLLSSVNMVAYAVAEEDTAKEMRGIEERGEGLDLVIADLMRTNKTRLQLTGDIRGASSAPPKILFMSSFSKMLDVSGAQYNEIGEYIEKPFVPSDLIERISAALKTDALPEEAPYKFSFPDARVLLCEDNEINQDVAAGMLEIFGINPVIAENGEQALRRLEEQPFDLVFMDILMPVLSGHDAACRIRSSEKAYRNVPIIAMTANSLQDEIDRCSEEGMNGYIIKPIEIETVYGELLKWLPEHLRRGGVEQPQNAADVMPALEGIDVEGGIKRFNNKRDKYEKALVRFSEELSKGIGEVMRAVDAGEPGKIRITVHKIKGVAGNLGAMELYEAADRLENSLKGGGNDEASLFAFIKNAETVENAINKVLKSREAYGRLSSIPLGTDDEALLLLSELIQAVKRYDPEESERVIEKLRKKEWTLIGADKLHDIYNHIEDYNFDEAEEKINLLLTGRNING